MHSEARFPPRRRAAGMIDSWTLSCLSSDLDVSCVEDVVFAFLSVVTLVGCLIFLISYIRAKASTWQTAILALATVGAPA